jgi:hypothetical protein
VSFTSAELLELAKRFYAESQSNETSPADALDLFAIADSLEQRARVVANRETRAASAVRRSPQSTAETLAEVTGGKAARS